MWWWRRRGPSEGARSGLFFSETALTVLAAACTKTYTDFATITMDTTQPLLKSSDDFFFRPGSDRTYTNSYTLSFSPSSALDGHRLTYQVWIKIFYIFSLCFTSLILQFKVPKMAAGNCAFLSDLMIAFQLKLTDSAGNKPPDGALVRRDLNLPCQQSFCPGVIEASSQVAPINAFPQTMIRQTRLYLNDVEVSSSDGSAYALKAYTNFALNYGLNERHSWLEMFGYYMDQAGTFQSTDMVGGGFYHRADLFSKGDAEGKNRVYHGNAVPVYSKVFFLQNYFSLSIVFSPSLGFSGLFFSLSPYLCNRCSPTLRAARRRSSAGWQHGLKLASTVLAST